MFISHTVVRGDTVWALSIRYGSTISGIITANGLNAKALIRIGQKLRIPVPTGTPGAAPLPGTPTPTTTTPATPATSDGYITHVVVRGDTVGALSVKYGSTISGIIKANNLNSRALIIVGQKLKIPVAAGSTATPTTPAASDSFVIHTVVRGDTVGALSVKYGSTISGIIKANNLNSRALIIVGQKLKIPVAAGSTATPTVTPTTTPTTKPSASPSPTEAPDIVLHKVVAGDTVWALAVRYHSSVSAIIEENNLNSKALIVVGQVLRIPVS